MSRAEGIRMVLAVKGWSVEGRKALGDGSKNRRVGASQGDDAIDEVDFEGIGEEASTQAFDAGRPWTSS